MFITDKILLDFTIENFNKHGMSMKKEVKKIVTIKNAAELTYGYIGPHIEGQLDVKPFYRC